MAEVVGVRAVRADDPAAPQFVERGHERGLLKPGGGGQHVGGERLPDGRGDPDRCRGRRREPRQAPGDYRLHLRGCRGIRPQCLDDEQRIAFAVAIQPLERGRVQRRAGDAPGQQRRLLTAEPAERDLGEAAERLQRGRQARQRVLLVEFLAPGSGGDEQPRGRRRAH